MHWKGEGWTGSNILVFNEEKDRWDFSHYNNALGHKISSFEFEVAQQGKELVTTLKAGQHTTRMAYYDIDASGFKWRWDKIPLGKSMSDQTLAMTLTCKRANGI